MSVVIQDQKTKKIFLMCKGADDVIIDRSLQELPGKENFKLMQGHVDSFARIGLRTLLLAQKEIS